MKAYEYIYKPIAGKIVIQEINLTVIDPDTDHTRYAHGNTIVPINQYCNGAVICFSPYKLASVKNMMIKFYTKLIENEIKAIKQYQKELDGLSGVAVVKKHY